VGIPEYEESNGKNSKPDRFNSNNKYSLKDDTKSTASGIKDAEIERLDKL